MRPALYCLLVVLKPWQWDLGEFNQSGTVKTRWGTREELLSACKTAREHGIDILIDAVLNVRYTLDKSFVLTYL